MKTDKLSRRHLMRHASLIAAGAVAGSALAQDSQAAIRRVVKKGRINQSASRWCYGKLTLDQLCEAGATMGLKGIDLLGAKDFPTLKRHGLVCTMTSGGGDLNNKAKHSQALTKLRASIEANAEYGYRNVIAMSGNRNG
ncbi:MAG: hydroxypyruvate isomerase, partial [Phycisphaeraceae bacterium]|nr:hydroxypyruvate isomerase [Phycisphaeraceae bacterium]